MKCFKEVAFATVMCGAMVMASCSKREVLPIGEKPNEVTKKEVSTAYAGPAIYVETADGVVHNTGLRANGAGSQREWTSPDRTVRVSGLGSYDIKHIENSGITVEFRVKNGLGLSRYAYRFEGSNEVTEEAQKEKDRVWRDSYKAGKGLASLLGPTVATDRISFFLPSGTYRGDVSIPEGTHRILLRVEENGYFPLPTSLIDYMREKNNDIYIRTSYHSFIEEYQQIEAKWKDAWKRERPTKEKFDTMVESLINSVWGERENVEDWMNNRHREMEALYHNDPGGYQAEALTYQTDIEACETEIGDYADLLKEIEKWKGEVKRKLDKIM